MPDLEKGYFDRHAEINALGVLKTNLQKEIGDLLAPLSWLEPNDAESADNMEKMFKISWPELQRNAQLMLEQVALRESPLIREKIGIFLNKILVKSEYSPASDKEFISALSDEYDELINLIGDEIVNLYG